MNPSLLLTLSLALLAAGGVSAETADRTKPIEINAQRFQGDEIKQTAVYTGAVEVHQGTLEITGSRLEVKVSPEGYRYLQIEGRPVKFKEKRDTRTPGVEEWVHASALNVVYDEKTDTVTLRDLAKLARSENGLVKDSSAGSLITYDLRYARSTVQGSVVDGKKTRVSTILAPRPKSGSAAPAPAPQTTVPPMKGSTRIQIKE